MSVYDELRGAQCRIENYESDLWTPDTPVARAILEANRATFYEFRSNLTGSVWLDVPYLYDPYWEQKQANGR